MVFTFGVKESMRAMLQAKGVALPWKGKECESYEEAQKIAVEMAEQSNMPIEAHCGNWSWTAYPDGLKDYRG